MTPCLVDANVWLALLVKEHVHHVPARAWFESLGTGEAGLCRFVQLTLIRLLSNRTIMESGALSAAQAWSRVAELLQDERVELLAEPPSLDSILPRLLLYPVPTPNLAAFAMSSNRKLVTRDRGFQEFRELHVHFLEP